MCCNFKSLFVGGSPNFTSWLLKPFYVNFGNTGSGLFQKQCRSTTPTVCPGKSEKKKANTTKKICNMKKRCCHYKIQADPPSMPLYVLRIVSVSSRSVVTIIFNLMIRRYPKWRIRSSRAKGVTVLIVEDNTNRHFTQSWYTLIKTL